MIAFPFPRAYRPFVEHRIAETIRELRRDADLRTDEDARVRKWAPVPDHLITPGDTGDAVILIGVGSDDTAARITAVRSTLGPGFDSRRLHRQGGSTTSPSHRETILMHPQLGKRVTDRITRFSGIVTGRVEYLTGCNQLLVQPPVDEKGAFTESRWLDEQRLDFDATAAIRLDNAASPGADAAAPIR